jgi:hypothetical protein
MELYNASGQLIASNNDWKSSQQSAIEATGVVPHDERDAAILTTLPDGHYTAGEGCELDRGHRVDRTLQQRIVADSFASAGRRASHIAPILRQHDFVRPVW